MLLYQVPSSMIYILCIWWTYRSKLFASVSTHWAWRSVVVLQLSMALEGKVCLQIRPKTPSGVARACDIFQNLPARLNFFFGDMDNERRASLHLPQISAPLLLYLYNLTPKPYPACTLILLRLCCRKTCFHVSPQNTRHKTARHCHEHPARKLARKVASRSTALSGQSSASAAEIRPPRPSSSRESRRTGWPTIPGRATCLARGMGRTPAAGTVR